MIRLTRTGIRDYAQVEARQGLGRAVEGLRAKDAADLVGGQRLDGGGPQRDQREQKR